MSLIPVAEALRRMVDGVRPVAGKEGLPLRAAVGRVLASDLRARRTQPAFEASAMDGYAVRAIDVRTVPAVLRLVGESAAGRAFDGRLGPGEAVRIFTGAPMPAGGDAVVIQENAERPDAGTVRATEAVEPGRHVRRAGVDFGENDVLLPAGSRLTAGAIALAASGGHPALEVLRRPRVAILATGDELVLPGEAVGASQIVASNSFGIAAIVETAGGEVLDYGIAGDRLDEITSRLDRALSDSADVFVTIGGASVGDHDLVGRVFEARGVSLDFWKVAMRPGKPLMAGRLGEIRLVGLPGNPASSMVTAILFLRPLVEALGGRKPAGSGERIGRLGANMPPNDHRADYLRATIGDSGADAPEITPLPRQDSSLLSIYARADALLVRLPGAPAADKGEPCRFIALDA